MAANARIISKVNAASPITAASRDDLRSGDTVSVEHDTTATGQAAGVVALVALAGAIGGFNEAGYGVIGGVGGVVGFVPLIFVMFFFVAILEDSGYIARVAFIMDRVMSLVGLNGKAFLPYLSSYACAVPGIMAARTIDR